MPWLAVCLSRYALSALLYRTVSAVDNVSWIMDSEWSRVPGRPLALNALFGPTGSIFSSLLGASLGKAFGLQAVFTVLAAIRASPPPCSSCAACALAPTEPADPRVCRGDRRGPTVVAKASQTDVCNTRLQLYI